MSDDLKPALSAEEWASVRKFGPIYFEADAGPMHWSSALDDEAEILALANFALPDDSPCKITREDVGGSIGSRIAPAHRTSMRGRCMNWR